MKNIVRNFFTDVNGYASTVFALSIIPVFGLVSLAVDLTNVYTHQTKLQIALDGVAIMLARNSVTDRSLTEAALIKKGKTLMGSKVLFPIEYKEFSIDTKGVEVSISAKHKYKTIFAHIIDEDFVNITGVSKAVFDISDIDFYTLMDNSPSMGFAATQNDVKLAYKVTDKLREQGILGETCAFACHNPPSEGHKNSSSNYKYLKNAGVKLRIDSVSEAYHSLINKMKEDKELNTKYRMAGFTFGKDSFNRHTHMLHDLTDDYAKMYSKAKEIKLMADYVSHGGNQKAGHFGHSNFLEKLTYMKNKIMSDQKGSGKLNKQMLFLITDGLHIDGKNTIGSIECVNGHKKWNGCIMPIAQKICNELKNEGVSIAILYTEYLEFPKSHRWNQLVRPITNKIEPALANCASPNLYKKVSFNGDSIKSSLVKMFEKSVRQLQLTR